MLSCLPLITISEGHPGTLQAVLLSGKPTGGSEAGQLHAGVNNGCGGT